MKRVFEAIWTAIVGAAAGAAVSLVVLVVIGHNPERTWIIYALTGAGFALGLLGGLAGLGSRAKSDHEN